MPASVPAPMPAVQAPTPAREITCPAAEDTRALGERVAEAAGPGTVVLLQGDLGAGKTVFAQGVGRGLGVPANVNSPTFVLINEHLGGRLPLRHADLYRLDDPVSIAELGLDEAAVDGILLVEWPERAGGELPRDRLLVRIEALEASEAAGDSPRRICISAEGERAEALFAALDLP